MEWDMDFKPIAEKSALAQGDGSQYSVHVAEIIHEIITNFVMDLNRVKEKNPNNEELLYIEAAISIDNWLRIMKDNVNKRNQSVFWAKNLLVLLAKTLDQVKDWHPYLEVIDKQLKSMMPKHYSIAKKV
ncbi:hypothetical protein [Clostridium sp. UBA4548]|uniref:hypothetical protein n=1 Tax=Clostridium sp. UBA4548 TaxID=1946361 RepID=UPI0025BCCB51|nr:hypothetical protein [Clostridium sp. UBA4548]